MSYEVDLEARRALYGDAYLLTSEFVARHANQLAQTGPLAFPIIMIHNKLMRALALPDHRDNFVDIVGYAQLALKSLQEVENGRGKQNSRR